MGGGIKAESIDHEKSISSMIGKLTLLGFSWWERAHQERSDGSTPALSRESVHVASWRLPSDKLGRLENSVFCKGDGTVVGTQ